MSAFSQMVARHLKMICSSFVAEPILYVVDVCRPMANYPPPTSEERSASSDANDKLGGVCMAHAFGVCLPFF